MIEERHNYKRIAELAVEACKPPSLEDVALRIAALCERKKAQYGDSIRFSESVLNALWPDGVRRESYRDMLLLVRVMDKIKRVASGNQGDESAWDDIAGYALRAIEGQR